MLLVLVEPGMGYYIDDDGDPIEYDDTPEAGSSAPTPEYGAPALPVTGVHPPRLAVERDDQESGHP